MGERSQAGSGGGSHAHGLMKEERIPFLEGRPEREADIGSDDVTDLKIVLNTTRSLEEFLEKV